MLMNKPPKRWHPVTRPKGWLALATALVVLAAGGVMLTHKPTPARHITLTAGYEGTTRAAVTRALAMEIAARGIRADIAETGSTEATLHALEAGKVDFALVSGVFHIDNYARLREVAPLYPEALHLLVKKELAEPMRHGLAGLRGHTVSLGAPGSTSAVLAAAVLAFSEIPPAPSTGDLGFIPLYHDLKALDALLEKGDHDALPDAIFHLATVPSTIVLKYVRSGHYRLVALPFADAFRLSAMISAEAEELGQTEIERPYVTDLVIPPYSYRTEPAEPADPIHTLGAGVLLVTRSDVSPKTVETVMEALFDSRFARIPQPPLERSVLALPPRIKLHPGAEAFRRRDRPLVTAGDIITVNSSLGVIGALGGSAIFLWQGWRQRRQAQQDALFGSYMMRLAEVEHRIVELELSANIDLESLVTLQQDLLTLKSSSLADFADGTLGNQSALFDLLSSINAAREHVGELLMHVRENLEDRAEQEGLQSEKIWAAAVEAAGPMPPVVAPLPDDAEE